MDLSYILYDTAVFGNAANTEFILFQAAQGSSTTLTENYTNSRGAGALPPEESFLIKKIGVTLDHNFTTSDSQAVFLASFLELRIADKILFKSPLALLSAANAFGGHYSQAAAADDSMIALLGNGYELEIPVPLPGGTSFRLRVFQGTALSGASKNVKVWMAGVLTIPG